MQVADVWSSREVCLLALSDFLGATLQLVQGSERVGNDAASATVRDSMSPSRPGGVIEHVVHLQVAQVEGGEVEVWALVFFFVEKRRVAPAGQCFLTLQWEKGRWNSRRWEADVYGEWTGLETLD
ncbi:hypothetical protein D7X30_29980 [Corallococcus sp. AB011P]|uniref:hypothetical protein n=1 Tax=Corallococcus sp. AB011P TaxID=2316735 RepID=UPI000EA076D6|nr:hypothetical protein [Corallococcus sp. AB011P]RKG53696.1 hypothetical protein D7X30_29980 [Corallococcus sp. AB011P]